MSRHRRIIHESVEQCERVEQLAKIARHGAAGIRTTALPGAAAFFDLALLVNFGHVELVGEGCAARQCAVVTELGLEFLAHCERRAS